MADALSLAVVVEAVGLLALPATTFLVGRLSGGVALARPLGLLLAAYPAWLLASLHLVRYGVATIALGLVALAALAAIAYWRGWRLPRSSARIWLIGTAIFWSLFLAALALRGWSADVWGVERPMDMAFVNATNRAGWFPPPDPWLAGSSLNYYYFGHYVVACLVRVTGSDPATAYGAATALFFGLSATAVFAVTASLTAIVDLRPSARRIAGAGVVAVALAMVLGPLSGVPELTNATGSLLGYRWWEPSRVIAHTANDFPAYSLLLDDLHAHVLAIPFTLLCAAFAMQLAVFGPRLITLRRPLRKHGPGIVELLLAALALGMLWATNSFSTPVAIALGAGGLAIWAATHKRWRTAIAWLLAWVGTSFVLFAPFLLNFHPATHGLGFVHSHPSLGRFALTQLLLYGTFAWVLARLFARRLRRLGLTNALALLAAAAALLAISSTLGAAISIATVIVLGAVWYEVIAVDATPRDRCLWLVVAIGATAALVGDLVYIRDTFDHGPDFRFNTVFKFGYQAWYLVAIAAGVTLAVRAPLRRSRTGLLWGAGLAIVILAAAVYPIVGTYSAERGFAGTPTLNGLRWLMDRSPSDAAAISWLRHNVRGSPAILEAAGADFSPLGYARVSVFTGLPTVLGWAGHEVQWGHRIGARWNDVHTLYASPDLTTTRRLLRRYHVRYVFVGSLEHRDYPAARLRKFHHLGRPVFTQGATTVYRV